MYILDNFLAYLLMYTILKDICPINGQQIHMFQISVTQQKLFLYPWTTVCFLLIWFLNVIIQVPTSKSISVITLKYTPQKKLYLIWNLHIISACNCTIIPHFSLSYEKGFKLWMFRKNKPKTECAYWTEWSILAHQSLFWKRIYYFSQ